MTPVGVRIRIAPGADLSTDPSGYSWQDVSRDWAASMGIRLKVGGEDEENEGQADASLTLRNGASATTGAGAGIVGRYTQDNPFSDLWPLWTLACPVEIAYDWGAGFTVVAVQFVSAMTMIWPGNSGRIPRVELNLGGRIRQEQIGAEVRSPMVATTIAQAPTCLWPLEGNPDSALTNGVSMTLVGLAAFGGVPVAVGGGGAANFSDGGQMRAPTGLSGASVTDWEAEVVVGLDELPGSFPGSDIRRIVAWQTPTSTTVAEWGVCIAYDGVAWRFGGFYSASSPSVTDTSLFSSLTNTVVAGQAYHVRLIVAPYSGDPTKMLAQVWVDDVFAGQVVQGSTPVTEPTEAVLNNSTRDDRPPANVSSVSQVALWAPARVTLVARAPAMRGYVDEQAHVRWIRVCTERRVPYSVTATKSTPMGPQPRDSFVRVLRDIESTDLGMIDDSQGVMGYRAGSELYNLTPVFNIDGAAWELDGDYAPTLDDQKARSDTTATASDGTKVRVDSGRLPRYTGGLNANVSTTGGPGLLRNSASWRNHLGRLTTRYPSVGAQLHESPQLIPEVMAVRLGDVGELVNPPRAHAPGQRLLQVRGWESDLEGVQGPWSWKANAVDASLYEVYQVESGTGNRSRINPGVSTLDAAYSNVAVVFSVTSAQVRWIDSATYPTMFGPTKPLMVVIAGEVMEVVSIVGTTLTQTFTVVRGTPTKALPIGSAVTLYRGPVTAF